MTSAASSISSVAPSATSLALPGAAPVVVVGGGPAGLMAAEVLASAGVAVHLYDAMPSVGRKFLLAGKGGLNLTHSEPHEPFMGRYAEARAALAASPAWPGGAVPHAPPLAGLGRLGRLAAAGPARAGDGGGTGRGAGPGGRQLGAPGVGRGLGALAAGAWRGRGAAATFELRF